MHTSRYRRRCFSNKVTESRVGIYEVWVSSVGLHHFMRSHRGWLALENRIDGLTWPSSLSLLFPFSSFHNRFLLPSFFFSSFFFFLLFFITLQVCTLLCSLADLPLHQFHCFFFILLIFPHPFSPSIHSSSLSLHPLPCQFQRTKCLHLFSLHLVSCFSCFLCPLSFTYLCHLQHVLKHLAFCAFFFSSYTLVCWISRWNEVSISVVFWFILPILNLDRVPDTFQHVFFLFIFPFRPSIE